MPLPRNCFLIPPSIIRSFLDLLDSFSILKIPKGSSFPFAFLMPRLRSGIPIAKPINPFSFSTTFIKLGSSIGRYRAANSFFSLSVRGTKPYISMNVSFISSSTGRIYGLSSFLVVNSLILYSVLFETLDKTLV